MHCADINYVKCPVSKLGSLFIFTTNQINRGDDRVKARVIIRANVDIVKCLPVKTWVLISVDMYCTIVKQRHDIHTVVKHIKPS